ncbi:OmpA family protein [Fulvivirga lutea]|uniref:OmpA family protein n=1 Tax=Fulvivirga lutea TaxID=2810512 RepID=A0A974WJC7_9BACT|nr:OmpA family protein [Fulvivirga lutea]QSE98222.1 OmpA family protein [Fulvivirga lutea]
MKKHISLFICLLHIGVLGLYAQDQEPKIITYSAKVIDADSKEAVDSKVKYESLPYGSKIGVFSGSTFTFNLEEGNDYALVVRADGYATHSSTIKNDESVDGKIEQVIELVPNGVNRLIRLDKLIFALGKADISAESYEELNQIVAMLNDSETMTIQLEGHTDFRGNEKQNFKLSEERVESVRDYLVKQGIDKKRIKTKAFGGSQPLSREGDAESRAANRRVEVRILTN